MPETPYYARFAEPRLTEAMADSPAVLIHGPRQCGKTTLAQLVGRRKGYAYVTFDDAVTREVATTDPIGFVTDLPPRVILDEVQRVPELFTTLKMAIDRKRTPGRFVLTGSANVLLLPKLADSLAGRMAIQRLHPLAQSELARHAPDFIDRLFGQGFKMQRYERLATELADRICAGGYPAALALPTSRRRTRWYVDYLDAIVQRDAHDIARIASLDVLPRLLALAAGQTARLLNVTDLAAPFQLSRPTIVSSS